MECELKEILWKLFFFFSGKERIVGDSYTIFLNF